MKIIVSTQVPRSVAGPVNIKILSPTKVLITEPPPEEGSVRKFIEREFLFDLEKVGYGPDIMRVYRKSDQFAFFWETEFYRDHFIADRKRPSCLISIVHFAVFPGATGFAIFTYGANVDPNGHEVEFIEDNGIGGQYVRMLLPEMAPYYHDVRRLWRFKHLLNFDNLALSNLKIRLLTQLVERLVTRLDIDVSDIPEYARTMKADPIDFYLPLFNDDPVEILDFVDKYKLING